MKAAVLECYVSKYPVKSNENNHWINSPDELLVGDTLFFIVERYAKSVAFIAVEIESISLTRKTLEVSSDFFYDEVDNILDVGFLQVYPTSGRFRTSSVLKYGAFVRKDTPVRRRQALKGVSNISRPSTKSNDEVERRI